MARSEEGLHHLSGRGCTFRKDYPVYGEWKVYDCTRTHGKARCWFHGVPCFATHTGYIRKALALFPPSRVLSTRSQSHNEGSRWAAAGTTRVLAKGFF